MAVCTEKFSVLHIDTEKGWRGGEQQLLYLIKGLSQRGINCGLVCKRGEELERRARKENIRQIFPIGNICLDIIKLSFIAKNYDILHAHTANAHTISVLSSFFCKKPIIYTRRVDYKPKNKFFSVLKYKKTNKVVAITNVVKQILINYGIDSSNIDVIHSCVDEDMGKFVNENKVKEIRRSLLVANKKIIVGSAGAIVDQKDYKTFVRAASFVLNRRKDVLFVIVGDGKLRKDIEKLIRSLKLSRDIKILDFKEDIQNYIKAFDIFVLSSKNEGMGSVLLQAMVLKVPIVSTDAGGVKEVIIDGETGILVPIGNAEKIASGINKVLKDQKLKEHLILKAYGFVKVNFASQEMVKSYIDVYEKVLWA
ncbi:MAG: glycosyltransferase [Campylobacterota bacterium]|nr:glycosyltransferase [Campylobacterota bacterium]